MKRFLVTLNKQLQVQRQIITQDILYLPLACHKWQRGNNRRPKVSHCLLAIKTLLKINSLSTEHHNAYFLLKRQFKNSRQSVLYKKPVTIRSSHIYTVFATSNVLLRDFRTADTMKSEISVALCLSFFAILVLSTTVSEAFPRCRPGAMLCRPSGRRDVIEKVNRDKALFFSL
jgi:hypothetical protein